MNGEIKIQSLESAAENELTVSAPGGSVSSPKAVSEPDSTQSQLALIQPSSSRIILKQQTSKRTGVTVHDVAAFILQNEGEMTAMKLQKLVYYSQAWSLVWDEQPLFDDEIEAWANGPVVRSLYARHQGHFKVSQWNGNPEKLSSTQQETVLKVLEFYGPMPAQVLSELTHSEEPWIKARIGLGIGERGSRVISHADMVEYYSGLD